MRGGSGILRHALGEEASNWRAGAADFAKSILLLSLALLAALYSNTSARSGQMPAAIAGAGVALSLATWVAWRFVPRMAATVEWNWLPLLARVRLTREGWVALGLILIVGLTAINTSNNLLYMIFSALLAALGLSLVLAALNLRALAVRVVLPAECFARTPFPMSIRIRNSKSVIPAFSIRIAGEDGPVQFASAYLPLVEASATRTVALEAACRRRGKHEIGRVRIESRFPFGLFIKTCRVPVAGATLAYPALREVPLPSDSASDIAGSGERLSRGQGVDLYRIRDYQGSDGARHIDWKASARTSLLKTKEYSRDETRHARIVLDRYGRPGDEESFEELVSAVASTLVALTEAGIDCDLVSDDWTSRGGADRRGTMLRYLAVVRMSEDAPFPPGSDDGGSRSFSLR